MTYSTRLAETASRAPGRWQRRAWLPIPLLLTAIVALWVADPRTVYESRGLMVLLNLFFTWLASFCICTLTARGFLTTGQPGLLMFGCGSLLWGSTSLAAAMIVGPDANPTVTVHNLGVFGASLCHFAGMVWTGRLPRPGRWLTIGYTGALAASALIFLAATSGRTPLFFVQGQGGTLLRQAVLLFAIALFSWVARQMVDKSKQRSEAFYYWYGCGLGLVATGLIGVMLLTVQGGLMGWTNRLTQYLGSAYLLVAALLAVQETGSWRLLLTALGTGRRENTLLAGLRRQTPLVWLLRYLLAVAVVTVAVELRVLLESWVGPGLPPYITFYPAIMVIALVTGCGPCILGSTLLALVSAYWILPPAEEFYIASPVDRLGLAIFSSMNVAICLIAESYWRAREKAVDYEKKKLLYESEQRFSKVFDHAASGIAITECEGRFVRCNAAYCELTGYSHEELLETEFSSLIHQDDLKYTMKSIGQLLGGEIPSFEIENRYLHKNGKQVWVHKYVSLLNDDDGTPKYIVALVADVTVRIQAEEELRRQSDDARLMSKKEFRSLAEAMPQIVWATRPDGWNIYFNQQWADYTGLTLEESYGHGWNVPFHPDDRQQAWEAWQRATQLGERYSLECRLRRADGAYRWWLVRGEPMRGANGEILKWFGTCTDIEELKRSEALLYQANDLLEQRVLERTRALQESEHQFRVMIQNLHSAVALINERGAFMIVNQAFLRMFELNDDAGIKDLNDRDWSQWQVFDEHGSLLSVDEHPVRKAALTCGPVRNQLIALKAPANPKPKWLLVSAEPILNARGAVQRLICTYYDITDRMQAEEALKRLNADLERKVAQRTAELREKDQMLLMQSRQAAMGEMIGNIAHQWRQPLNVLGLNIQQQLFYYDHGEFTREFLDDCVNKSMKVIEHMSNTIDDFRNYFKPDKERIDFKVQDTIASTLSLINDSFKNKHIAIEIIVKDDPVIHSFENEFAQVALNILNNAKDVLTERKIKEPRVTITIDSENGRAVVTIADNAGGIPDGIIEKVFDPYFTTKGPQTGTGVGLFMSKAIIEKNMHGHLTARNTISGAEFRIEV